VGISQPLFASELIALTYFAYAFDQEPDSIREDLIELANAASITPSVSFRATYRLQISDNDCAMTAPRRAAA
jgi:hypothetical protein